MAEQSGPENYAPKNQRAPTFLQQQRGQANPAHTEGLDAMIQGVASMPLEEIDRVIHLLEGLREYLRKEGERVSREVARYASLSNETITAMKVLADSIKEWKGGPEPPSAS
jgi:hypothetical protein